jgi:hypothetical protein
MNNLLELKGIDEKWYLIYGGNDGQMILLTRELFEILNNEINDPKSKPMKVEDWLKIATYGTLSEPELIDTAIEPKVGDRINHRSLGLGIIQLISDRGVATINFELHGQRNVILQYAKFEIL